MQDEEDHLDNTFPFFFSFLDKIWTEANKEEIRVHILHQEAAKKKAEIQKHRDIIKESSKLGVTRGPKRSVEFLSI
ncbi:unnamed protein product [Citrullus colocynthis]|uniref:Uncharacterized protein n=1 Tax=Citrullus colocynthis TaxID=252529 RepID=A0ABP0XW42_9ROSI